MSIPEIILAAFYLQERSPVPGCVLFGHNTSREDARKCQLQKLGMLFLYVVGKAVEQLHDRGIPYLLKRRLAQLIRKHRMVVAEIEIRRSWQAH